MKVNQTGNLALIYLGLKGGGSRLLVDVSTQLSFFQGIEIICADDCEDLNDIPVDSTIRKLRVPHRKSDLFRLASFIISGFRIFKSFDKTKVIIFIMPHFLDYYFLLLAKLFCLRTVYFVHDAQNHSGENWPTKSAIRRRLMLSKDIVAFSDFVKDQIKNYVNKEIRLCELRHLPPKIFTSPPELKFSDYSLVIGRIKEYKGVNQILDSWHLIDGNENLVIAGEGKLKEINLANIQVINRWLDNEEFWYLIYNAKLIILPYTDASQSGVLSCCNELNKLTLVSDVGGLKEQLKNAITIDENFSLLENIQNALRKSKIPLKPVRSYGEINDWNLIQFLKSL